MPTRAQVYAAIDSERDYQDHKWNSLTTTSGGAHTPTEFLVYMQHYLNQAVTQTSTQGDPLATDLVLESIRKITALGVVCMEQNGAPLRQPQRSTADASAE